MSPDVALHQFVGALTEVAPEVDPATLDPDADLFAQVDIDSMDLLTVLEIIRERTGVDVPEDDYAALATPRLAAAYIAERAGG